MFDMSLTVIGAGLVLGLMHALDADHIMAVSALSNEKPGALRTLKYCLQWAMGHGGVLLACGMLLFGLGLELPETVLQIAEASVGVLLIGIGLLFFWRIRQQKLRLNVHSHGDLVHSHWHVEDAKSQAHAQTSENVKDHHAPVFVGMLHGLAGSAPALALVPVMANGQLAMAVAYLLIFSLGVVLSMMLFGLSLGLFQNKLQQFNLRMFQFSRHLIAGSSIMLGGFWLSQTI